MRVCVDIQAAVTQRAGIGRYVRQLVTDLAKQLDPEELRLFFFDFQRGGCGDDLPADHQQVCRWVPGRVAQLAWRTIGWPPFDAFAGAADVYHFPNFVLPPLRRGRSLVTIHDMSFERLPLFTEEKNLRNLTSQIRRTVKRADAITTISHFSKQELCELMDVPEDKVHPIHLGVDAAFTPPTSDEVATMRRELKLDRPYLLSVGTLEPRKNYAFMVDVFEQLADFDGELVLTGMRGWKYEPILERIRQSPLNDRIRHIDYVPEGLLPALYGGAELFLLTSFYEGFGLPPLESMACGTPVVCSAGGALPEVVSDAGCIVPEHDIDSWREAIESALSDSGKRATMRERGIKHAATFRWEDTAKRTLELYRMLAS